VPESRIKSLVFQIVSGVVILILGGTIGYFGSTFVKKFEVVDINYHEIELLKEEIKDLEEALSQSAAHQGMADADLRRFDRSIAKLEAIVERLEREIE
jgi:hypothetical protein